MNNICPNCKNFINLKDKKCRVCGFILSQDIMQKKNYVLCPGCNNYEFNNQPKCRRCGYVLISQTQPQHTQQMQPQQMSHQYSQNPQLNHNNKSNKSCLGIIIIFIVMIIGTTIFSDLIKYIEKDRETNDGTTTEYVNDYEQDTITTTQETVTTTENPKIDVSIKEQIVYDENGVIIKITGIKDSKVSFYIENNSDLNLSFNMHSYAVNSLMTNENIYTMDCGVVAHSKNTCELDVPEKFLKDNDIDVIKNLTLHIWAYNNDTYMKEFDCGSIVVDTSASDGTNSIQNGEILLEENGIKYELLKKQGNVYYIGLTNNNDVLCEFDIQNLVINDWTCDISYDFDLMGLQILPNCQNILALDMTKHIQEKGITETKYISFNLDVRRNADYFDNYIGSTIRIE